MTTSLPCTRPDSSAVPIAAHTRVVGEVAVVHLSGELDLAAVDRVTAAVADALATRPTGLVLDVSEVPFCDTVGLRVLLSAAGRAHAQGCAIGLAGVQPAVADLLARVCAERVLPGYADLGAAIEGLMFAGDWR